MVEDGCRRLVVAFGTDTDNLLLRFLATWTILIVLSLLRLGPDDVALQVQVNHFVFLRRLFLGEVCIINFVSRLNDLEDLVLTRIIILEKKAVLLLGNRGTSFDQLVQSLLLLDHHLHRRLRLFLASLNSILGLGSLDITLDVRVVLPGPGVRSILGPCLPLRLVKLEWLDVLAQSTFISCEVVARFSFR